MVSPSARKLFSVIVQQAHHGPIRPKPDGTATPPEILEACGLDVEEFYALLNTLQEAGLIWASNTYPFEEIQIVTFDRFEAPPNSRYFEDYVPGRIYEFGTIPVSEAEIVDFAQQFDPQYFHTDPEKAKASRFGGLVASGWHTTALVMRLFVDQFLSHVASLASPGVDEIRWPNPVRPGDNLRLRVTILEARPSRTKPDRGVVRNRIEAFNQRDEPVLSMIGISIIGRRAQS
ncbi:MAG: MaoC family dehydratase [Acidobacteriia bacterium]|nr:MaoC family dehydratase [Terriglobia bacterium]